MKIIPGSVEMTVKPEVQLLGDVLNRIASGSWRIPRFQRPFVWRPDQMLELFDSLERGYPVGSLLVWQTDLALPSLDRVGGIAVPAPPPGVPTAYVLDGHQRLSTLFGTLSGPDAAPDRRGDGWIWHVFRELADGPGGETERRRNRYRHWKKDPVPADLLPMHSVMRTLDFLAFARGLQAEIEPIVGSRRAGEMIDEAEQVSQRIKSYRFAVITLEGGTMEQAVEVFSRLNSKGSVITPQQMVSALTYDQGIEESLGDRISLLLENLGDRGFSDISSSTVFRAVLAVSGEEDVQTVRWGSLAARMKGLLAIAVGLAEAAMGLAVDFLRGDVGVPHARLVPYSIQILLLTVFFNECPEPDERQRSVLVRWFWSTSWSGFFASANSTQVKIYLAAMKEFAHGGRDPHGADEDARPFPDRFDTRSARVRTLLLWELQEFPARLDVGGRSFNPIDILVNVDTKAYRHVVTSNLNERAEQSPANRLILPTPPGRSVRSALLSLEPEVADRVLASHGIPLEALEMLRAGDGRGFIHSRARYLAQREREFMRRQGLRPAEEIDSATEIDTE
ncbi:DUF262 domain-containing protein [Frankia sp. AgKG'84/4]|uniref:DUF262 domain-containing protein n=1 Tax=Frankia sp. AgKG'84/4 TaxID=573490 RepID=UPI00200CB324|nr:DUF262 domain-containing protein [Frankia sp. AgKG'84/4]MCL9794284.1 DUF262 domain-containing protein [Frankia sp. AgKG'84/4]